MAQGEFMYCISVAAPSLQNPTTLILCTLAWPLGESKGALNNTKHKGGYWTHFSAFEVWDNISNDEIAELDGLFRHLYRFDSKANALNKQKAYRKLGLVRKRTESEWL